MIKKLFQNLRVKVGKDLWWSDPNRPLIFFYLLLLFLSTQAGFHIWPEFSFVNGIRLDYLSPTLYLTDILIFTLILFSYRNILRFFRSHKKDIALIILVILFLLSGALLAKSPYAGIYGVIKVIEYMYLGLFIYVYRKSLNLFISAVLISIGIAFESLLAILQYFNQGSFQGIFYFLGERAININTPGAANTSINGSLILRPYGTFPHPNVLGGVLVISLALVLPLLYETRKLFFTILVLATVGVIFSFSRTALVALLFYLVSFFLISIYEKYKKGNANKNTLKQFLLVLVIIVLALGIFASSIFSQRIVNLKLSDESVTQRMQQTEDALSMFYQNPLFGVGLNNYFYHIKTAYFPLGPQPVHNIFLFTLAQTGLIGLLTFLWFLLKTSIKSRYSFLVVIALFILGSFDHYLLTIQQGQLILTIATSMLLSFKLSAKI